MRSKTNVVVTAAVNFANFESWLLFLVKCFAVCAVELCSHSNCCELLLFQDSFISFNLPAYP